MNLFFLKLKFNKFDRDFGMNLRQIIKRFVILNLFIANGSWVLDSYNKLAVQNRKVACNQGCLVGGVIAIWS